MLDQNRGGKAVDHAQSNKTRLSMERRGSDDRCDSLAVPRVSLEGIRGV